MTITLNGDSGITAPTYGGVVASEYHVPVTAFKNRIINGQMQIDQRNAGASVATSSGSSAYITDRFFVAYTQTSKMTGQQNAGTVTPPAGFTNYLGVTSSSAYSVLTGDTFGLFHRIEGFNTADLGWGSAGASTVTLSFWVRSSLTGTFGGALQNAAADRSYPFSYSIPVANTWTQISVTIVGDTTGTWVGATNGVGIQIVFGLGSGSTYSGTGGAWAAGNYRTVTGATSVVGTNGATFYITGVQLEKGSTATSFDYRPYGTELSLCQRYYYRIFPAVTNTTFGMAYTGSATQTYGYINFPVLMRVAPSALEQSGTANNYMLAYGATSQTCNAVPVIINSTVIGSNISFLVASGLTTGQGAQMRTDVTNGANAYLGWSAEL